MINCIIIDTKGGQKCIFVAKNGSFLGKSDLLSRKHLKCDSRDNAFFDGKTVLLPLISPENHRLTTKLTYLYRKKTDFGKEDTYGKAVRYL